MLMIAFLLEPCTYLFQHWPCFIYGLYQVLLLYSQLLCTLLNSIRVMHIYSAIFFLLRFLFIGCHIVYLLSISAKACTSQGHGFGPQTFVKEVNDVFHKKEASTQQSGDL